jgi:hypothetical protein
MASNNACDGGELKPEDCLRLLETFNDRLTSQYNELRAIQAGIGQFISTLKVQSGDTRSNILAEVGKRVLIIVVASLH